MRTVFRCYEGVQKRKEGRGGSKRSARSEAEEEGAGKNRRENLPATCKEG